MNVALINPPARKIVEYGDAPEVAHLGLAYLGAALLKKGIKPVIIDARYEQISFEQVLNRVCQLEPHVVGITAMTHMINDAHDMARKIKSKLSAVYIVIGGPHAGAIPQQTLQEFSSFDSVVIGEGDITFIELLEELRNNEKPDLSKTMGLSYREDKKVITNKPRPPITNVDSIPFPAWQLLPRSNTYNVMTQRGCPGKCNFCLSGNRRVYIRTPENIVEEIDMLVEDFGARTILFGDNFGVSKRHAHNILDLMMGRWPKLKWRASLRANMVDEELAKKMKYAGCTRISFGVESGDRDILRKMHKGITIRDVMNAARILKKMGMRFHAFFIIGHPGETHESARKSINLLAKMNPDAAAIGLMVPYPGTGVYDIAKKGQGGYKVLSSNWDDYNKQIGNALELENLSRKEMEKLQMLGYIKLYICNFRIRELIKVIYKNRRLAFVMARKFVLR